MLRGVIAHAELQTAALTCTVSAMAVRRLNEPIPAQVRAHADDGRPWQVRMRDGSWREVEHVLDEWEIDDRWWTDSPVRRNYFACQLLGGMAVTVMYDLSAEAWYVQR